jgi:diguanylate cyclase (GGDEF)-like protein/PAS domain S-box-containing protein
MAQFLKDRKYQFMIPIVVLSIYSLIYIGMILFGNWMNHHLLFLLSIFFLVLLNVLFLALQQKSKIMVAGVGVMLISTFLEIVVEALAIAGFQIDTPLIYDIFIHIMQIGGTITLSVMAYLLMRVMRERNKLFHLFFTYNQAIYQEYNHKEERWTFTLSPSFASLHHLDYSHLTMNRDEFRDAVHVEDREKFDHFVSPNQVNEVNLRIRFPKMSNYTWIHSKVVYHENDKSIGIIIDISHYQSLIDELDQSQMRLGTIEMEERAILEHTNDLILKVRLDGKIVFATENYANIFGLSIKELLTMTVTDINRLTNITNDNWFRDTAEIGYSESVIELEIKGEIRWIFWKNRTLNNNDGDPEFILSVGHDITDMKRMNNDLYLKSLRDDLTGLYNRTGLFQELEKLKNIDSCVLFFLDLDNFAYINDYFGHEVGDLIIQEVATELLWFRRKGGIVSRISGDEFVIAAHDVQSIQESILNIYRFLETTHTVSGASITIKKNIGYAVYPDDAPTIKGLVSLASMAMLESKASQIQTAVRYKPEFQAAVKENLLMAGAIKHAIEASQIDIHFQNVIHAPSGEFAYIESLARWTRENGEIVPPITLFFHATQSKLVQDLDRYLIDRSLRYFQILSKQPQYQDTILAVNVAPSTLLDKKFPDFLRLVISKYALSSFQIMIEVAETTFIGNLDHCFQQLRSLKKLGVRIAIDDFGRDYSSLSILTGLDFDVIKIDRVFVDKITMPINREIITMVQKIALSNGKVVIAEGVETKAQAESLHELGIDFHQGYYYGKPKKMV